MADLVLRDLDPLLEERIRRVAVARGWTREYTCVALLEQGLFSSELEVRHRGAAGLAGREVVLKVVRRFASVRTAWAGQRPALPDSERGHDPVSGANGWAYPDPIPFAEIR